MTMGALRAYSRWGLWALVVWAVLLVYGTATHQPPYQTQFAAWSRYVTTTEFLLSHLVASIAGAAFGVIGFAALTVLLLQRGAVAVSGWAFVTAAFGLVFTTSVFGIAAFAQPAIGRAYLAGHGDVVALYNDVNGAPLLITALFGVLCLSASLILYGIGVIRTRVAPRAAGWALAIGGPLFAIVGVVLADIVQSIGAVLLLAGTGWLAWAAPRSSSKPLVDSAVG